MGWTSLSQPEAWLFAEERWSLTACWTLTADFSNASSSAVPVETGKNAKENSVVGEVSAARVEELN